MVKSAINVLYDCDALYYTQKVRAHFKDERPVFIPYPVLVTSKICGSMGMSRPGQFVLSDKDIPKLPSITVVNEDAVLSLPSKMTDDYISYLSMKFPDECKNINAKKLHDTCVAANYANFLDTIGKGANQRRYKKDWISWIDVNVNGAGGLNSLEFSNIRIYNWEDSIVERDMINAIGVRFNVHFLDKIIQREIMQKIVVGWKSTVPDENPIIALLNNIVSKSTFKDISTTAQALGVNHIEALNWIILNVKGHLNKQSPSFILLNQIVGQKRSDILDFLTSDMFIGLEWLCYKYQPSKVLACVNMAKYHYTAMLLNPMSQLYNKPVNLYLKRECAQHALNIVCNWNNIRFEDPRISY